MPRNPRDRCDVSWSTRYGTASGTEGNLPTHKTKECVSEVVTLSGVQAEFPWVTIADFHYYHIKCPYSTESPIHYRRDINRGSATYWQNIDVSAEAITHPTTSGIMIRHSRGSKYGWLCVDPDCPYYKGTASGSVGGSPYFYI
jgi:hypothetical protein